MLAMGVAFLGRCARVRARKPGGRAMTKNAIDRSQERGPAALSRRRSGTQLIQREDALVDAPATVPTSSQELWLAEGDQDGIPTQPENERPSATAETMLPPSRKPALPIELPQATHDESRDTIPSPPPERE